MALAEEKLAQIRAFETLATDGPWGQGGIGVSTDYWQHPEIPAGKPERIIAIMNTEGAKALVDTDDPAIWLPVMRQDTANGEFIANARDSVPAMIKALAKVLARCDRLAATEGVSERSYALRDASIDIRADIEDALDTLSDDSPTVFPSRRAQ
jgi:hypothetical protein